MVMEQGVTENPNQVLRSKGLPLDHLKFVISTTIREKNFAD